jgi:hypothetical protein
MDRSAILIIMPLLSLSPARAQTGSVRIRVTNTNGHVIHRATVALYNNWNHQISTTKANDSGEVVFPRLAFGEWRFVVAARDLSADVFALNICRSQEQVIQARHAPVSPDALGQDIDQIIVWAEARLVRLDPMPYCDVLDPPKPITRR